MFTLSLHNANHPQDLVRTLRGCVSTDIEVHVCAAVNPFAYHLANLLQFHDDTGCAVAVRHIFGNLLRDEKLTILRTHLLPLRLALHVSSPSRTYSLYEQLEHASDKQP